MARERFEQSLSKWLPCSWQHAEADRFRDRRVRLEPAWEDLIATSLASRNACPPPATQQPITFFGYRWND